MAFSNLTRIILFIVAGISILVILFFYVGPKTVNYNDMEVRVQEAQNPVDMTPAAPLPTVDPTAQEPTAPMVNAPEAKSASEVLSGWELLVWNRIDIALIWAYILLMLTALAAIIFPLITILGNPKGLIRLALVLVGGAVLVLISYLMASGAPMEIIGYTGTANSDPSTLKMVDTVLFVTYILFGIALASILYAIISKAFK
ncbi:MAG: hypothetical protein R6W31_07890 [Bacteroidales bacterium]